MNFFEHQRQARRSTRLLVLLFVLAVLVIAALVGALTWYFYLRFGRPPTSSLGTHHEVIGSWLFGLIGAASALAVILLSSLRRMWQLRQGGVAVAREMGAVRIPADSREPLRRKLINVTEEIAIASRVAMPRLFLLEKEQGLNAFAAGYSEADSAIVVTQGLLECLNRDELQAVIAHEFSHIQNGDMRLNIRLMALVHGILSLSLLGKSFLAGTFDLQNPWERKRDNDYRGLRAGWAGVLFALLLIVIGSIGVFFARLIKAAVSRQREFLADASAVQFTRQKDGLAGALKKIGGLKQGSYLQNGALAESVSHMLFSQGQPLDWFATHPPLIERIRRLQPWFRPAALEKLRGGWRKTPPDGLAEDLALGFSYGSGESSSKHENLIAAEDNSPRPLAGEGLGERVARQPPAPAVQIPHERDLKRQKSYQDAGELPETLRRLAHDAQRAPLLLLSLLTDRAGGISRGQYDVIESHLGTDSAFAVRELSLKLLAGVALSQRLPLAILAFPALHGLPADKRQSFSRCMDALIHADGDTGLFAYCLSRLLQTQLRTLEKPAGALFGRRKLAQVKEPVARLLAVLALAGSVEDEQAARRAFLAAWHALFPNDNRSWQKPASVLLLDSVWPPLDALDAISKELLLEACAACVLHDGILNVAEADLLRTVCGILHCPLPELLQGRQLP